MLMKRADGYKLNTAARGCPRGGTYSGGFLAPYATDYMKNLVIIPFWSSSFGESSGPHSPSTMCPVVGPVLQHFLTSLHIQNSTNKVCLSYLSEHRTFLLLKNAERD